MRLATRAQLVFFACALLSGSACQSDTSEDTDMGSKPTKPATGLQSDPHFYKLNSVMGEVRSDGRPVPGATVTILETGESFPVEASGSYVIVLDPERLGGRGHELAFRAPGFVEQRQFVLVPENNQTRLDVELVAEKR